MFLLTESRELYFYIDLRVKENFKTANVSHIS